MNMDIKAYIKKLWHDGKISDRDVKEALEVLEEHDKKLKVDATKELRDQFKHDVNLLKESIEDYWKDCDEDVRGKSDETRCTKCNKVLFEGILEMLKWFKL